MHFKRWTPLWTFFLSILRIWSTRHFLACRHKFFLNGTIYIRFSVDHNTNPSCGFHHLQQLTESMHINNHKTSTIKDVNILYKNAWITSSLQLGNRQCVNFDLWINPGKMGCFLFHLLLGMPHLAINSCIVYYSSKSFLIPKITLINCLIKTR